MDEELQLKKRFEELYNRSYNNGCYTYTDFLTLAQQDILVKSLPKNGYSFWGGYENAERKIACFGSEEICGYADTPPVYCVKIEPLRQKFADALTHRDFLGSLMALGIKREALGDIIVFENTGYLFCLETITPYIVENCVSVRHTSVSCAVVDKPPVESVKLPDESETVTASLRCDAVIAAVYKLSRSESQKLFEQKLVFINSANCLNASQSLNENDLVSVRGKGRFIFCGKVLTTKKGRMRISVRIF